MIREVAHDVRLGSEAQVIEAQTNPTALSKSETATPIAEAPEQISEHKNRRLAKVGVETFLTILALVVVASILDPLTFFSHARKGLEIAKHNLNQWRVLVVHRQAAVEQANAEVESIGKDQRVMIESGSNVYKIANNAYGAKAALGMDLIKEFNPQVKNLNRVSAGQDLVLPPLTRQTLIRRQPDGSYHLIVASFRSPTGANEYGRLLSNKGYRVAITPRRVSDDLLLHRVGIDGLKNLDEANRIWQTALTNEWLEFAGNPTGTR